jgi:cell division protease FtsH
LKRFFTKPANIFFIGLTLVALSLTLITLQPKAENAKKDWPYNQSGAREISLSEAWGYVDLKDFDGVDSMRVGVLEDYIYLELEDETVRAKTPFPHSILISDFTKLSSADLQIYENPTYKVSAADRIFQILPLILIVSIVIFILARGATKGLGLTSSFEIVNPEDLDESFDDVAGIDNARDDISEIVDFLKDPKAISTLGGRMPKGALFAGPPGTGKTLLARAMAKEAGVPFIAIDASSVSQIFVGAGAMKIRKAFKEAKKMAPCIVFIDEIDAMGRARGGNGPGSGSSDEKETTLNTLLVELDGFGAREGVVLIAATNRPEILDPALTRRGRIDRRIDISLPDLKGRHDILQVHLRKVSLQKGVTADAVAKTTYGFSGADLGALVNEAALAAARRKGVTVTTEDFTSARDKMILGQASSNRILSEEERDITAYHEAGHAFIAATRKHADPIEKVTIIPQGSALGFVLQSPDQDRLIETKARLLSRLDVAVAGRAAERLFKGEDCITTGAESDIEIATRIARGMVEKWGMSEKGFIRISGDLDPLHDGETQTSDAVKKIIQEAMDRVEKGMSAKKAAIKRIANALLERETLSAEQIYLLISNKEII